MKIEVFTPEGMFEPIGPYSHVVKAGPFITISGTPGVDPQTSKMAGIDAYSQAKQIIKNFQLMLSEVGASLKDVIQVHVYLKRVEDFGEMNRAYAEEFGSHRPARTVICVADLPKQEALMTMNLSAIIQQQSPIAGSESCSKRLQCKSLTCVESAIGLNTATTEASLCATFLDIRDVQCRNDHELCDSYI